MLPEDLTPLSEGRPACTPVLLLAFILNSALEFDTTIPRIGQQVLSMKLCTAVRGVALVGLLGANDDGVGGSPRHLSPNQPLLSTSPRAVPLPWNAPPLLTRVEQRIQTRGEVGVGGAPDGEVAVRPATLGGGGGQRYHTPLQGREERSHPVLMMMGWGESPPPVT